VAYDQAAERRKNGAGEDSAAAPRLTEFSDLNPSAYALGCILPPLHCRSESFVQYSREHLGAQQRRAGAMTIKRAG